MSESCAIIVKEPNGSHFFFFTQVSVDDDRIQGLCVPDQVVAANIFFFACFGKQSVHLFVPGLLRVFKLDFLS